MLQASKVLLRSAPCRFLTRAEKTSTAAFRLKSTQAEVHDQDLEMTPDPYGDVKSIMLESEKFGGYLSKILSAKVYDAAVETELQEAENLSKVCKQKPSSHSRINLNLSL